MDATEHNLLIVMQRVENLEQDLRDDRECINLSSRADELQAILMELLRVEGRLWEEVSSSTRWNVYAKLAQAVGWRDAAEVAYDFARDLCHSEPAEALEALNSGTAFAFESAVALARLTQGLRKATSTPTVLERMTARPFAPGSLDS